MRIFKAVVYAVTVALFLAGCSTHKPIYNVTEAPVAASKPLDANQVKTAIVTAGGALGWRMREVSPGMLEGTLVLREHTAVVDIAYSAKSYSITYKSSVKLDEKDGQIHKNYNGWIQNLDKGIRGALAAA
jgi:hypothetical protein